MIFLVMSSSDIKIQKNVYFFIFFHYIMREWVCVCVHIVSCIAICTLRLKLTALAIHIDRRSFRHHHHHHRSFSTHTKNKLIFYSSIRAKYHFFRFGFFFFVSCMCVVDIKELIFKYQKVLLFFLLILSFSISFGSKVVGITMHTNRFTQEFDYKHDEYIQNTMLGC